MARLMVRVKRQKADRKQFDGKLKLISVFEFIQYESLSALRQPSAPSYFKIHTSYMLVILISMSCHQCLEHTDEASVMNYDQTNT